MSLENPRTKDHTLETKIDFLTFRELLESIENSEVSLRLRMPGERWTDFSKLILLSQNAMILQNGSERRIILNVRSVVEFEVDKPVRQILPRLAYEITH